MRAQIPARYAALALLFGGLACAGNKASDDGSVVAQDSTQVQDTSAYKGGERDTTNVAVPADTSMAAPAPADTGMAAPAPTPTPADTTQYQPQAAPADTTGGYAPTPAPTDTTSAAPTSPTTPTDTSSMSQPSSNAPTDSAAPVTPDTAGMSHDSASAQ
jgi:hypothetical protein